MAEAVAGGRQVVAVETAVVPVPGAGVIACAVGAEGVPARSVDDGGDVAAGSLADFRQSFVPSSKGRKNTPLYPTPRTFISVLLIFRHSITR